MSQVKPVWMHADELIAFVGDHVAVAPAPSILGLPIPHISFIMSCIMRIFRNCRRVELFPAKFCGVGFS